MSARTSGRLLGVLAAIAALAVTAGSATAQVFTIGFNNDPVLTTGTPAQRAPWIARATALGANMVRVSVFWREVAPAIRPSGFKASNPASPGYYWTPVDATLRQLSAAGVRLMVTVDRAPDWAQGPGKPASAFPGTWKPSAADFGAFATAIAKRYSGHYPDPLHRGQMLPKISLWQGWNEPELSHYLTPQWIHTRSGYVPASPDIYRKLQNAFYAAIKSVSKSNTVFMGGMAPFGDPIGGLGMRPIYFLRHLFCLSNQLTRLPSCPGTIHLDGMDGHPYEDFGPTHHAFDPDDATLPDMWKILRVTSAGVRTGRILPRTSKPLWATEFSWDTKPPDPNGISLATQAKWIEQGYYLLWKQGISVALYFLISDEPPYPSYSGTYQSGLYFLNGAPKPSTVAYSFPFVTARRDKSHVFVWGRAPATGTLTVQRVNANRSVSTLARLRVKRGNVFTTTLTLSGRANLRAQIGGARSLIWSQGA
jgi:hypothetical protein